MLRILLFVLIAVFALPISACGEGEEIGAVAYPIVPDIVPGTPFLLDDDGQPIRPPSSCDSYAAPTAVSTITSDEMDEVSGIVISRQYPDVAWVHNDSGDGPRVFAIRISTGALLSILTLENAKARDWEDIAIAPCDDTWCLFLADTGDNLKKREEVYIHRVREPDPFAGNQLTRDFDTMTLSYPDGAYDVEAVFAYGNNVYLLTKALGRSVVFVAPFMHRTHVLAERIYDMDWKVVAGGRFLFITGADFHPEPPRVIVRGYGKMVELRGVPGQPFTSFFEYDVRGVPVSTEGQGEAVGFADNGYYHLAEGKNPTLYFVACEAP